MLYSSLDDLFIGISILKTYHDFDPISLLFPNIIDERYRRNRNDTREKRNIGKTQVRKEKIERQDRKERLD